jgi:hypothetical protein
MSDILFQNKDNLSSSERNIKKKKLITNLNRSSNSNKHNRRIDSANTNFTTNTQHNKIRQDKNYINQSNATENYSGYTNYSCPKIKSKREFYFKPNWKYSYYLDKNDILSLNNLNNNPEMKNSLCDFKDIDKRPKPIVYSWTKPRMIKILENNANIEEEVKSHYWKYSHIFENNANNPPGKLLRIIMTQLSHSYGGGINFINMNRDGFIGDEMNFNDKISSYNRQWKVPGVYKKFNNNYYDPIKIKRPRTAFGQ